MKNNHHSLLLFLTVFSLLMSIAVWGNAQSLQTDNTSVTFEIKNAGITVDGTFDSVRMELWMEDMRWNTLELSGSIYVETIDTGIGLRDKHLRNEDYFNVEKYPWIEMKSKRISDAGNGKLDAVFLLTIRNVSKEISFPVTYKTVANGITLSGSFELDRRDFEVGGNSFLLSDDVMVYVTGMFKK